MFGLIYGSRQVNFINHVLSSEDMCQPNEDRTQLYHHFGLAFYMKILLNKIKRIALHLFIVHKY